MNQPPLGIENLKLSLVMYWKEDCIFTIRFMLAHTFTM